MKLTDEERALYGIAPGRRACLRALLFNAGFTTVALHHLAHRLRSKERYLFADAVLRFNVLTSACHIHYDAQIGPGLYLPHPTGIVVGSGVVIGRNVTLYQGVTLGRRRAADPAYPIVEDDVVIYPNATIVGNVRIGRGAVIGANSFVGRDVAPGDVVAGIPAHSLRPAHAGSDTQPAAPMSGTRPFQRWALLDRDGTIIVDKVYLSDPEGIEFSPGALEGLRLLRDQSFGLVLITNQSGIARGYFDTEALTAVHDRLTAMLAAEGIRLEAIEYCPHGPDGGCDCRKPAPGMIHAAMRKLGFGPGHAVMIGDSDTDMGAAAAAGIAGIRISQQGGAADFLEAAQRAVDLMAAEARNQHQTGA